MPANIPLRNMLGAPGLQVIVDRAFVGVHLE